MKMKIINKKTAEKKCLQLRRKTMTTVKLTIIALSAAAVVFSGCSTDNRIAGPEYDSNLEIDNKLAELNSVTLDPGSAARVAVRDSDSDREAERFSIIAKVQRLDVENGCWYLLSDNGDTYTPVSLMDLILESDMMLKATGYIDNNIQFFCGNGPAFVIESYEIISMPGGPDDRDSGIRTGHGSSNEVFEINDHPEDRAPSQPTDELAPQDLMDREYEDKKKYEEEQRRSEQPRDESAPTMYDDDDRPAGPADRDPSEDDLMDREYEAKKKYEEEQRRSQRPKDESAPTMYDDDDRPAGPADRDHSEDDLMDREEKEARKMKYEEEQRRRDNDNERP
jgi:hypothetical protein